MKSEMRWENGGCLPVPLVSIWITGKCPLRCKHCYESHCPGNKRDLPFEQVKLIMDRMAPHVNSISFMGGEPTVHPDIERICEYAKELGKYTLLVSNGVPITREFVDRMKGKIDCVKLGMDGVTAHFHDMVRGRGSFAKALRAWEIMAPEIPTMCKLTLNAKNMVELPLVADFYKNLGAQRLVVNGWLKLGSGASIWNREFALTREQRAAINKFVAEELKPNYQRFPVSRSCSMDQGCKELPARTYYIDSRAAVSPCIFSGHLAFGNMLAPELDVAELLFRVDSTRRFPHNLHEVDHAELEDWSMDVPPEYFAWRPQACPH